MNSKLLICFSLLFITLTLQGFSQGSDNSKNLNSFSATINGGFLNSYTDRNNQGRDLTYTKDMKGGFGFSVSKSFSHLFSLNLQYLAGNLHGEKSIKDFPANTFGNHTYFDANLTDITLNARINFSNMLLPKTFKERHFFVYGLIGLGITRYNSLAKDLNTNAVVGYVGYNPEGTSKTTATSDIIIPIGIGVKYKVNKYIDLGLESTMRYVNSDKIDALQIEGTSNDHYNYTCLTLTYKFGKYDKSYDWVNPFTEIVQNNELIKQKIMLLSRDSDYDGIVDYFDKEPETKEGAIVDYAGRTLDTDLDGVPDYKDLDNHSDLNAKVDTNGLEFDADKDGVFDVKDLEPNTPPNSFVNFKGQSIPNSGNGGSISNTFVNNVTNNASGDSGSSWLLPTIFFQTGSSEFMNSQNIEKLATIAQLLRSNPNIKLRIVGYADQIGGQSKHNIALSKKRAQSIYAHLTEKYLIDPSRLIVDGKGSSSYLSKDKEINRRVEFQIAK